MRIVGELKGGARLEKRLSALEAEIVKKNTQALITGVLDIQGAAIKSINKRSSGEQQVRYNPKRTVTASKPGDAPNTDTGRLVQSIDFEIDEARGVGRVGTNLKYGAWLEFGTVDMEARPWLRPAFLKVRKGILKLFDQATLDAIKKVTK